MNDELLGCEYIICINYFGVCIFVRIFLSVHFIGVVCFHKQNDSQQCTNNAFIALYPMFQQFGYDALVSYFQS